MSNLNQSDLDHHPPRITIKLKSEASRALFWIAPSVRGWFFYKTYFPILYRDRKQLKILKSTISPLHICLKIPHMAQIPMSWTCLNTNVHNTDLYVVRDYRTFYIEMKKDFNLPSDKPVLAANLHLALRQQHALCQYRLSSRPNTTDIEH